MPTLEEIITNNFTSSQTNPVQQGQIQETTTPQEDVLSPSSISETTTESSENLQSPVTSESAPRSVNWEKRYNDLQSDMDRRINNATGRLSQTYDAKINQLVDIVSRQQYTTPPPDKVETPEMFAGLDETQRAEMDRYMADRIERVAKERLGYDPVLQETNNISAAYNRYRGRHPGSEQLDFIIAPLLNEFEELDLKSDKTWDRAHQWAIGFVQRVLAAQTVTPQGAVSGNGTPKTTSVNPSTGGFLSPEQRSELEKRATLLKQTEGVSVGAAPSRGKLSLEDIIMKNLEKQG